MSTFEEEKDVRDLVLLNAEMQTIWNKKEYEVRDVLEKFSAYRAAVDSDAKEKDELFVEEVAILYQNDASLPTDFFLLSV